MRTLPILFFSNLNLMIDKNNSAFKIRGSDDGEY